MISDLLATFCVNQQLTVAAFLAGTDSIDLQNLRDLGSGKQLAVHFHITEAMTGAASACAFALCVADNAALTTNRRILLRSGVLSATDLTLNSHWFMPLPISPQSLTLQRFFGVGFETSGTISTGRVSARLAAADGIINPRLYPSANY